MKRFFIIAAVALMAAACDNTTTEQKIAVFDETINQITKDYRDAVAKIDADTELFKSGKQEEEYEKAYTKATSDVLALVNKTVKKYPKDTIALYAIQSSLNLLMEDITVLEPALKAISGPLAEEEGIVELKNAIATIKDTSAGSQFKDFTVDHYTGDDAEGNPCFTKVSLSDFAGKGKYILLDFWSPWCGPCKRAIPELKSIYEKYSSDNFDIVSVAVWESSRNMNYRNTVDTAAVYGITWNQINNAQMAPADLYGVQYIPYLFLIGPDGKIIERNLAASEADAAIAKALGR